MEDNNAAQDSSTVEVVEKKGKPPKKPVSNKVVWFVTGAILLCVIVAGFVFQRFAVAVLPGTQATVVTRVCTTGDIDAFNKNFSEDSFKTTIDNIAKRSGYNNDVNCVFMQYRYALDRTQFSTARERAARVEELVNGGNAIDNRINEVQSVATIQQNIEAANGLQDGKPLYDDSNAQ